jgi:hypothetical protein
MKLDSGEHFARKKGQIDAVKPERLFTISTANARFY